MSIYPDPAETAPECGDNAWYRKANSAGIVRLRVLVNSYCPFASIREQYDAFQFDSNTFSALPDSIQARVRLPGQDLDGIHLLEEYVLYTNLMFEMASGSTTSDELDGSASNDIVVGKAVVGDYWQSGSAVAGKPWVPHYAWTHIGSLFDNTTLDPDSAEYGASPSTALNNADDGEDSGGNASGSSTLNVAKWGYVTDNRPVVKDGDSYTEPNVLFPEQQVVGTNSATRSVHWSVLKRRPVYQGADFFLVVKNTVSQTTNQSINKSLLDSYNFLDSNYSGSTSGVLVNGGMVETDDNGYIVDDSRSKYDLNSQAYLIIEIGVQDEDNNYFLVIVEKASPICVHASMVPQLIKDSGGDYQVLIPTDKSTRRLSTYDGATGDELLSQDELFIRVKNYMGMLVVYFSGHDDDPWIIQRNDLIKKSAIQDDGTYSVDLGTDGGGNDDGGDGEDNTGGDDNGDGDGGGDNGGGGSQSSNNDQDTDPNDYIEQPVPMVVPAAYLAIHGGNKRLAFNWGYIKYVPQVTLQMPQSIHVEGVNNAIPSTSDVNLYLRLMDPSYRVNTQGEVYHQDAQRFGDYVAGTLQYTKAIDAQPKIYQKYGKGAIPNSGNTDFDFGDQAEATPEDEMSEIDVQIVNDTLMPVNPPEQRSQFFYVSVTLYAGNYYFPTENDDEIDPSDQDDPLEIANCITPICTGFALYIPTNNQDAFPTNANQDVSHHVLNFQETWSAQDYSRIEHTGTIKFLVTDGMGDNTAIPANVVAAGADLDPQTATNYSNLLRTSIDRALYVQISAWYENSAIFPAFTGGNEIIFTGLIHGGKMVYSNNNWVLECQVSDFSAVLANTFFLNSPFFDSVRDYVAVRELMVTAGFKTQGAVAPASFVDQGVSLSKTQGDQFDITYQDGGRTNVSSLTQARITCRSYALPGSYSPLQSPMFRFKDGDKFMDALTRMAAVAGKCIYFDRFGVLHYEDRIDQLIAFNNISQSDVESMAKDHFYASPLMAGSSPDTVVYNTYTWQRLVGDVFNQILVVSADPNGALIVAGDKNYDSIDSPNTSGFLGYQKQLMHMNGLFGSEDNAKQIVESDTTNYIPQLQVTFETFGRSYLKPLDIIMFTGLDQIANNNGQAALLRITNISTELDSAKNSYWSRLETEWIFPGHGVQWGTSPS